jgi:hypothetical protein
MNGAYFTVTANTAVTPVAFELPKTSAVYVYAVSKPGGVQCEYSTNAPTWIAAKKGWYLGERRALYKFVYVKDVVDQYAAKTFIDDPWEKFSTANITLPVMGNLTDPLFELSGALNPAPQTLTLSPGAYVMVLVGGGGGGGGGINGNGSYNYFGGAGGAGGLLAEVVTIKDPTTVTIYTGSGGTGAGYITYGYLQGCGGGGGGSGSFVYSADGYFGVAGGGGGGGGGSAYQGGGGGGGAGGSVGQGGNGGQGGNADMFGGNMDSPLGSSGGFGGGGTSPLAGNQFGFAGVSPDVYSPYKGTDGYPALYTVYGIPDEWRNTNGANGQGGNGIQHGSGYAGGYGGNNRTATRGGGSPGGTPGLPYDGIGSAGGQGGAGAVAIYKIF